MYPFAMDLNRGLLHLGQEVNKQQSGASAHSQQRHEADTHETSAVEPTVNTNTLRAAVNIQTQPTIAQRVTGTLMNHY